VGQIYNRFSTFLKFYILFLQVPKISAVKKKETLALHLHLGLMDNICCYRYLKITIFDT